MKSDKYTNPYLNWLEKNKHHNNTWLAWQACEQHFLKMLESEEMVGVVGKAIKDIPPAASILPLNIVKAKIAIEALKKELRG